MKEVIQILVGIIVVVAAIWGLYWLAKTGSYFFFYESMVQDTIRELVKPGALK